MSKDKRETIRKSVGGIMFTRMWADVAQEPVYYKGAYVVTRSVWQNDMVVALRHELADA